MENGWLVFLGPNKRDSVEDRKREITPPSYAYLGYIYTKVYNVRNDIQAIRHHETTSTAQSYARTIPGLRILNSIFEVMYELSGKKPMKKTIINSPLSIPTIER